MLDKRGGFKVEDEPVPEIDEGWWAAILSDENANLLPRKEAVRAAPLLAAAVVDWDYALSVFQQDEVVTLEVNGFNRGGLLVQGEGIQGFVPVSHLIELASLDQEEERKKALAAYAGRKLSLKVIECEPEQERIVLSERAALAGDGRRKQLFESLQVGAIVLGTVTNVTDFGAFVDLGGVEGLIHVSELSWGRVQHPNQVLCVGEQIKVLILQVSEENARIALSLKRLQSNPWELLASTKQPGDLVKARVTSITRYGAFARLNEGVEGLIHISSLTLEPGQVIEDLLVPGEMVEVEILHIDTERRRLGLGLVRAE